MPACKPILTAEFAKPTSAITTEGKNTKYAKKNHLFHSDIYWSFATFAKTFEVFAVKGFNFL
jgi:hypothetical protein